MLTIIIESTDLSPGRVVRSTFELLFDNLRITSFTMSEGFNESLQVEKACLLFSILACSGMLRRGDCDFGRLRGSSQSTEYQRKPGVLLVWNVASECTDGGSDPPSSDAIQEARTKVAKVGL